MTAHAALLEELNRKYGFIASVLVARDGKFVARVGDPKEPAANDPYNLFFRDAETIANTFAFLNGQSPKALTQGTREVIAILISDDLVLGLVKDDPRDGLAMFKVQQELAQELPTLLAYVRVR